MYTYIIKHMVGSMCDIIYDVWHTMIPGMVYNVLCYAMIISSVILCDLVHICMYVCISLSIYIYIYTYIHIYIYIYTHVYTGGWLGDWEKLRFFHWVPPQSRDAGFCTVRWVSSAVFFSSRRAGEVGRSRGGFGEVSDARGSEAGGAKETASHRSSAGQPAKQLMNCCGNMWATCGKIRQHVATCAHLNQHILHNVRIFTKRARQSPGGEARKAAAEAGSGREGGGPGALGAHGRTQARARARGRCGHGGGRRRRRRRRRRRGGRGVPNALLKTIVYDVHEL